MCVLDYSWSFQAELFFLPKTSAQTAANDLQAKNILLERQIEVDKVKDTQLRQTIKVLRHTFPVHHHI